MNGGSTSMNEGGCFDVRFDPSAAARVASRDCEHGRNRGEIAKKEKRAEKRHSDLSEFRSDKECVRGPVVEERRKANKEVGV